jgi:hypothetical protein
MCQWLYSLNTMFVLHQDCPLTWKSVLLNEFLTRQRLIHCLSIIITEICFMSYIFIKIHSQL